jgi:hypothetical protein
MTLDKLDQIAADLTRRMGRFCPRPEIEAIARELGRYHAELTEQGWLWASTLVEVEDYLLINDEEILPPDIVSIIGSQLLRQDYPAWRRHLKGQSQSDLGDHEDGDDDTIN